MSYSKDYRKSYNNKYWQENKEELSIKIIEYRRKVKDLVYYNYDNKCNCCGETGKSFLSIDHVNNDGYKDRTKTGKVEKMEFLYI